MTIKSKDGLDVKNSLFSTLVVNVLVVVIRNITALYIFTIETLKLKQ